MVSVCFYVITGLFCGLTWGPTRAVGSEPSKINCFGRETAAYPGKQATTDQVQMQCTYLCASRHSPAQIGTTDTGVHELSVYRSTFHALRDCKADRCLTRHSGISTLVTHFTALIGWVLALPQAPAGASTSHVPATPLNLITQETSKEMFGCLVHPVDRLTHQYPSRFLKSRWLPSFAHGGASV